MDKIEKRDYGREVTIGEIGVQCVDMEGFLQRAVCEREAAIDEILKPVTTGRVWKVILQRMG